MTALSERPSTTFTAPGTAFAPSPAEQRGLARDGVRLMVARPDGVSHARFRDLPDHLAAGDLVVVNNSATLAAQGDAWSTRRGPVVLHVATPLDDGSWVLEIRSAPDAAAPVLDGVPGEELTLGDLRVVLLEAYPRVGSAPRGPGDGSGDGPSNRLWRVAVDGDLAAHLRRHGRPVSYGYLDRAYPLAAYQSVFGIRPGSAEMPSAGRPFTAGVVASLVSRGVSVAPITLHTGLSSQEAGEAPQAERYDVPPATARLVNTVRAGGGRIVAVGTTVTRALESAVDGDQVVPRRGWTERVVTPGDPPRVVDALITGWHDPQASHLLLVEAVAGRRLAQQAYDAASAGGYLWHEFGDVALLLP